MPAGNPGAYFNKRGNLKKKYRGRKDILKNMRPTRRGRLGTRGRGELVRGGRRPGIIREPFRRTPPPSMGPKKHKRY